MKKILILFLFMLNITEIHTFNPSLVNYKIKKNILKIKKNNNLPNCAKIYLSNFNLKTSELKHGRIATLSVIGRIFAETLHPDLSFMLNSENLLVNQQIVPSLINGGLDKIEPLFYVLTFIYVLMIEIGDTIDLTKIKKDKNDNYKIDYDFFNIYKNSSDKNKLKKLEVYLCRFFMLLSSWFAYYEYATNTSIITPELVYIPWFIMYYYLDIFTE
jgi:hypothetical protein